MNDQISITEVASRLGTQRSTVTKLAREGVLRGAKTGAGKTARWQLDRTSTEQYIATHAPASNNGHDLTSLEAAKVLDVHPSYVGKLVRDGKLAGRVDGRKLFVTAAAVDAYQSAHPRRAALKVRKHKVQAMRRRSAARVFRSTSAPPSETVAKDRLARIEDQLAAIATKIDAMMKFWQ